jgi:acetyltransferase-like isoleucine patch superfamily enzyme
MMKRIFKKILRKARVLKYGKVNTPTPSKNQPASPKYKIGNVKYNNSLIDTLIPQFVEIGDNFVSAPGSIILAHDASLFRHTGYYRVEKTVIGNDVFLGANATILPGITIGDGAIIGAGAVVTKDVAAYTVVAGNPARFMCTVEEYIQKCKQKNCLYKAPLSFDKYWNNMRLTKEDIEAFQLSVMEAYSQRK